MTASASLGHLHPPGSRLNPNSAPAPPGGCQERRYSIESETTPMVVGVGLFVAIFRSRELANLQFLNGVAGVGTQRLDAIGALLRHRLIVCSPFNIDKLNEPG